MSLVYILECQAGKYYVGSTTQALQERFLQHSQRSGSAWTGLYPPIRVVDAKAMIHKEDEDSTTVRLMREHGIDNVRGGTYSTVKLPEHQYKTLEDQIAHNKNECFQCHQVGHVANSCPVKDFIACFRCGHLGHWQESCFAARDVKGDRLLSPASNKIPQNQRRLVSLPASVAAKSTTIPRRPQPKSSS